MGKLYVVFFVVNYLLYIQSPCNKVEARLADDSQVQTVDTEEQKRELLDVLHNVLGKLQERSMSIMQRRFRRLPGCNVGEFCSVRRGARHGQLCQCPRGSKCSFFFLKCL